MTNPFLVSTVQFAFGQWIIYCHSDAEILLKLEKLFSKDLLMKVLRVILKVSKEFMIQVNYKPHY